MKKVAVFVEGQTELLFVRHLLLNVYLYNVDITCNKLRSEGNLFPASYDFPCDSADIHYRLIDVGNDKAVLQRMLDRQKYLLEAGYTKIVGLRDMYSAEYAELTHQIDVEIIRKFIQTTRHTIDERALDKDNFKLCFAIMEIEAWFLGLKKFENLHSELSNERISRILNCDFEVVDPEREFIRPTSAIRMIYSAVNLEYDKSESVVESLCRIFEQEDYLSLSRDTSCNSFTYFFDTVIDESNSNIIS